jgi:Transposase protein
MDSWLHSSQDKKSQGIIYAHLRDHCFLSLPSPSTLTRYIDVVRVETGISTEMIDILSNKVNTANERYGILMFDEIHLREGMRFSSKVLEFDGLVDFGEFTPSAQRKQMADTGLVFMYRPIRDGWVQTVGLFLSKGPTPASVLSKLILKLIIALESHGLWVCNC